MYAQFYEQQGLIGLVQMRISSLTGTSKAMRFERRWSGQSHFFLNNEQLGNARMTIRNKRRKNFDFICLNNANITDFVSTLKHFEGNFSTETRFIC